MVSHSWCWPAGEWGWIPGCPVTGVCPLVGEAGPEARAGWLVGGARPHVSGFRALGVPGLVPAHWCVELDLQPSGGQGCVQGQLWTQGVLRQPACW